MGRGGLGGLASPAALQPRPMLGPAPTPESGAHAVTHLLPRLWLFLCLGTGGVGRLPATEASGQVGRRLNLAELEPLDGPVNRAQRVRRGAGEAQGRWAGFGGRPLAQLTEGGKVPQAL